MPKHPKRPVPSHESVDHIHPTEAGLEEPESIQSPGTGIMGDETLIHPNEPRMPHYPGIDQDAHPGPHGQDAQPGPTKWPNRPDASHDGTP